MDISEYSLGTFVGVERAGDWGLGSVVVWGMSWDVEERNRTRCGRERMGRVDIAFLAFWGEDESLRRETE